MKNSPNIRGYYLFTTGTVSCTNVYSYAVYLRQVARRPQAAPHHHQRQWQQRGVCRVARTAGCPRCCCRSRCCPCRRSRWWWRLRRGRQQTGSAGVDRPQSYANEFSNCINLSSQINMAAITVLRIRNYLFRIQLWIFWVPDPDPDPGRSSGSMRIRIRIQPVIIR